MRIKLRSACQVNFFNAVFDDRMWHPLWSMAAVSSRAHVLQLASLVLLRVVVTDVLLITLVLLVLLRVVVMGVSLVPVVLQVMLRAVDTDVLLFSLVLLVQLKVVQSQMCC